MNIEYRIYIIETKTVLCFPFHSIDKAEKHIKYLESLYKGSLLHHEVRGFSIPQVDEDTALGLEDRQFENRMLEHYVESGKDWVQL